MKHEVMLVVLIERQQYEKYDKNSTIYYHKSTKKYKKYDKTFVY
jgi:hypothetical protein